MNNQDILRKEIELLSANSRIAYMGLMNSDDDIRNKAIILASEFILRDKDKIINANLKDIEFAKQNGKSDAIIDRLMLDDKRIKAISDSMIEITKLDNPLNKIRKETIRPNGLVIKQISVPIGVIGMIYESRPNVTADAFSLCLKSGNVVILRPSSESYNSSYEITFSIKKALKEVGLSDNIISLIPTKAREAVDIMLTMDKYIDVIIPRGGKELIKKVSEISKIPVIKHLDGNCHTYIHKDADFDKAIKVLLNAKMRRTGVCGATESLVVDIDIADKIIPKIVNELLSVGCEIRGDDLSQKIDNRVGQATDDDYYTEYLDKIISLKIVKNEDEAIEHINKYGSSHTDAIVTENNKVAEKFLLLIDSAITMVNASTQFADGGEFGMGAEIGIATGRLHARGPVGIEELTTYKYKVYGNGQTRS